MLAFALIATQLGISEEFTTTESGKRVLEDGTWEEAVEPQEEEATETDASQTNFRRTSWGMSLHQVKSTEEEQPVYETDGLLMYNLTVGGLSANLFYRFLNGLLGLSTYVFTESHSNKNLFIDDYLAIKAVLRQKYGSPLSDQTVWRNSLFKNDPEKWGTAVSIGHLSYKTYWELEEMVIMLSLIGDEYDITHTLVYSATNLSDIREQAQQDKNQSDF